ncbi:MAG: phosphoenolpyruvate-protein phosphotransferase [Nitrospinaceae bacterium]|nr:MAG: phosphoenolpyruvate-protein phosphotransferase [Nitrospinaceae bacterium]
MFNGIALSKGVAIGKAYLLDSSKFCVLKQELNPDQVETEVKRFRHAIELSKLQMQEIKKRASKVADKYAVILDTYTLLLEDEVIVNDTIENIRGNRLNAEWALTETLNKFTKLFNNINDDYLKGKKDDLDLVVHGIIRNLIGHSQEKLSEIDEPVILVSHTLSPSDTIAMPKNLVLGMATEVGGKTSHVAIFASALGIPLVGGIKDLTGQLNSGDQIIIDGIDGRVIVNPSAEQLKHYQKKQENYRHYEQKLLEDIHQPARTLDGVAIKLMANIESPDDLKSLRKYGAEGIGLYRTEFLYLMAKTPPTESELYETFKRVVQEMAPLPVVIRTLDIGMDKTLTDMSSEPENNPALGLRGIRLSLSDPGVFIYQLKAILRASLYGNIKILFPMLSSLEEFSDAKELLETAKNDLKKKQIPFDEEIPVGTMVETPAAAICADHLLKEVDFISIGTNDLIQYLLAVDRTNENVAPLYQPFHPSVLKTLKNIFQAAKNSGKDFSICGELGGDPLATAVLLGLGNHQELSMEPHSIPKVKKIIRKISLEEARQMADHVLGLTSTDEINQFILKEMQSRFPSDFDRGTSFEEKMIPAGKNSH